MTKIHILKECGCFRDSDFVNNETFESKDDALLKAKHMVEHMNNEFCGKHSFTITEVGDELQIVAQMDETKKSSGCCGGGHCS